MAFLNRRRTGRLRRQSSAGAELPVNVMVMDGVPSNGRLAELGVARISYGPIPYIRAMNALKEDALKVLS